MTLIRFHNTYAELYERMYKLRGVPRTYVAYIRGGRCTSYKSFHAEVSAALQFPDYYGENINALAECLEDLEWLNADNVYVFIDQAECYLRFDQKEDSAYSKIFEAAMDYWKGQEQTLHVFLNFQRND